jgi:hypothetical protein
LEWRWNAEFPQSSEWSFPGAQGSELTVKWSTGVPAHLAPNHETLVSDTNYDLGLYVRIHGPRGPLSY